MRALRHAGALSARDRAVELVKQEWCADLDSTVPQLERELEHALAGRRPAPDRSGVDWSAFFLSDPVR